MPFGVYGEMCAYVSSQIEFCTYHTHSKGSVYQTHSKLVVACKCRQKEKCQIVTARLNPVFVRPIQSHQSIIICGHSDTVDQRRHAIAGEQK